MGHFDEMKFWMKKKDFAKMGLKIIKRASRGKEMPLEKFNEVLSFFYSCENATIIPLGDRLNIESWGSDRNYREIFLGVEPLRNLQKNPFFYINALNNLKEGNNLKEMEEDVSCLEKFFVGMLNYCGCKTY